MSCWRAASHSCRDTIAGLLVVILFLLCFLTEAEPIRSERFSEPADAHRQNSSGGSGSGHHHCGACDACWAHGFSLLPHAAEPDSIAAVIAAICLSEAFGDDWNCRPKSTANESGKMSS